MWPFAFGQERLSDSRLHRSPHRWQEGDNPHESSTLQVQEHGLRLRPAGKQALSKFGVKKLCIKRRKPLNI